MTEQSQKQQTCKHQYIVGYSSRMPSLFFKSVPCDHCTQPITLSVPWRIFYLVLNISYFIAAFNLTDQISISILGTLFLAKLAGWIVLLWILERINRFLLRYAKWVEATS